MGHDSADSSLKVYKVVESVIREASIEMLILGELPLSFIESVAWRHFCSKAKLYKPVSRRTSTREIVMLYVKKKASMKKILGKNKQRLSLTTDIRVSNNTGDSYMVITAHFVDANWQLKKMILGFKHVIDHKGGTICKVLLECLDEWDIRRVFCITVDNATANSTAMNKFKKAMKLIGDDALILKGEYMHLRCAAHILNLIVKEGLHKVNASVAVIRNGIQFVRSSTNRLKSFDLCCDAGKISRGSNYVTSHKMYNETVNIARNLTALNTNPMSDEGLKKKAIAMIGKLKKYWDPFGEEVEMNRLVMIATVFDPRKKMKFVELCFARMYGSGSVQAVLLFESVIQIMKDLYDEYSRASLVRKNNGSDSMAYSQSHGTWSQSQEQVNMERTINPKGHQLEDMENLFDEIVKETGIHKSSNELDLYLNEAVETPQLLKGIEYDVLSWWKLNSGKFPVLSLIAKDIFAMQVSSVASESAFSTSGRVLDTIQKLLNTLHDQEEEDELMREFDPKFYIHGFE
ncbi:unnamed protein product [Arabidopsis thaliana]|uniref:(thale cress) hypothetical protein n=1 Tax=Arabidopsis thaliana TaxID=3702 RepID=A0A7G2EBD2_ARATH|nr:unnamed protein product [Arabidopsis thaliana]